MKDTNDDNKELGVDATGTATAEAELLREEPDQQRPLTEMERQATSRSVQRQSEQILALTNPGSAHGTSEALSRSGSNYSNYSSVQLDGTVNVIQQGSPPAAGRDSVNTDSDTNNNNTNTNSSFAARSAQGHDGAPTHGRRTYEERVQAKKEAFDAAATDNKSLAVGAAAGLVMPPELVADDKASQESMASVIAKVERYANANAATPSSDKADDDSKIKDDASSLMRQRRKVAEKGPPSVPGTSTSVMNINTSCLRDSADEDGDASSKGDNSAVTSVHEPEPELIPNDVPSSSPTDINLSVAHAITTEDLEAQIRSSIISGAVQATCVTPGQKETSEADKRSNAAANDADQAASKKRRIILMMLAAACFVVVGVVAVLLSRTSGGNSSGGSSGNSVTVDNQVDDSQPPVALEMASPTAAPTTLELQPFHLDFLDWLKQNALNPEPLTLVSDDSTAEKTPQYQSFTWLASDSIKSAADIPIPNSAEASLLLERYALACVYYSTFGDEWTVADAWLTPSSVCEWYGITCDPVLGNVIKLEVRDNNVRGSLPADIGHLGELKQFQFGKNPFNTSRTSFGKPPPKRALQTIDGSLQPGLPTTIGLFTKLEFFALTQTGLGGSLPTELGLLVKLKRMKLRDSYLVGELPSELGNLGELTAMDLPQNGFTGTLPSDLGRMSKLDNINVEENKLVGTIPIEYTSWTSPMRRVRFEGNLFDPDTIEATLCNATLGFLSVEIAFSCPVSTCSCCTECD